MKKLLMVLTVVPIILGGSARSEAGLLGLDRNSSDIVFSQSQIDYADGNVSTSTAWDVSREFQISLLGEQTDTDVWNFNHYDGGGSWDWSENNFADYPYYHLQLDSSGSVPASFYTGGPTGEMLDWALYYTDPSGNIQTVLGGTIEDAQFDALSGSANFTAFLRISPSSTYRTFDGTGEGFVNTVEIWGGAGMSTDLVGYQISGSGSWGSPVWESSGDITLQAQHIPEPSTLLIWSLLGGLAVALGWWRRRR